MYRFLSVAVVVTAASVAMFSFASAKGIEPGTEGNGLSVCEETYLANYEAAHKKLGAEAVGANLVDDGMNQYDPYQLPEKLVCEKAAVLDGMLNPVVVAEPTATTDYGTVAETAPASSGGYAIPDYIVQCESGGDYGASNPSGAYGAYQIMPGTASAYGCDLSTAGGQDACAAEIYAAEGSAPWACG